MTFDEIYRAGVSHVWEQDAGAQEHYLSIITEARSMGSQLDFRALNACFIPNDGYMEKYFGSQILDSSYGCYQDSVCFWNNCLVFPIYNISDRIVSLAGFHPIKYAEARDTGDWGINYYMYSSKDVFEKRRYLFCSEGTFRKAFDDGFLFVVDGLFDCLALDREGFHAAALMGSALTPEIVMILRFIKHVIFITDNDPAGIKLYERARMQLNNVGIFVQGKTKDIDELLKSSEHDACVKALREASMDKDMTFYRFHVSA